MSLLKRSSMSLLALAAVTILATGCATNETRQMAEEAKATADAAMQKANEADARSRATEEKIDRMFKRSMYK